MNIIYIQLFTCGIIFSLGIFHILVSIQRSQNQKRRNITFSLLLFSILLYLLVVSNNYKNFITDYFGISLSYIFSTIFGMSILFFILNFILNIFEYKKIQASQIIFILSYFIFTVIIVVINIYDYIFSTSNYSKYFRKYALLCSAIIIFTGSILGFYNIIKYKKYKNIKNNAYILGIIFIFIHIILVPLSFSFNFIFFFTKSYIGFSFITIIFSFAISKEFTQEHLDLINLKSSLEQKVIERTKQLEEKTSQLEQANRQIKKVSQQKTNFFINLTHETKTPLTLISNYLDKHINKHGLTEEIKTVKQNVDKLQHDIINFMDTEKFERGQALYNHDQIINLSNSVSVKAMMFKEIANKKNIDITTKIDENIHIKIDPDAIDRIINNLIDNAVKYTLKNGTIIMKIRMVICEFVGLLKTNNIFRFNILLIINLIMISYINVALYIYFNRKIFLIKNNNIDFKKINLIKG